MLFSLIIPHHNSSILLERLLKSVNVINDMQIIVVDDNSNNTEIEQLKKLKYKYKFDLLYNKGKTAGGARNTGIEYAQGKWLIFADADDYFTTNLPNLLDYVLTYPTSDIIFFDVTSVISETGERANRDKHIKQLFSLWNESHDDRYMRCKYLVPWGKIYKKDFILSNNIKFEECIAGNDMWFAVQSGVKAKNITIIEKELYVCTISTGSITTTLSKDRHEAKFQATLKTNDYLKKHGYKRFQISILYFIAGAMQFGFKYLLHVLNECRIHHSNLFIGTRKLFHIKEVLEDRQNPKFIKK